MRLSGFSAASSWAAALIMLSSLKAERFKEFRSAAWHWLKASFAAGPTIGNRAANGQFCADIMCQE